MKPKNIIKRIVNYPLGKLDNLVKRTNWYKNSIPNIDNYPGDTWYRRHLERNYDIINLGSSSAVFCFNYDELNVKAFNWALKPQSMEYSFKVLQQYYSILKQKGNVLIPFSPFSGLSVTGKWTESANDKYYHILDYTLIDNYDDVARRRSTPFRSDPINSLKRLLKDVPKQDMYSYNVICSSPKEFETSAKNWINLWKREFNIQNLDAPLSKENKDSRKARLKIVKEIINFCNDRDLCPIIVIPPLHKSLKNFLTPIFVKNYITSFIGELHIPDLKILDYLNDSSLDKDSFYRDAYFMNTIGAKTFTKKVLADLELL